jgi:hypothetical protein
MLDTSASMDTKLKTAQEAAIGFVRRLRPQDLAEVIDFDSRVNILAPFTGSAPDLEQAILKTSAGGSTSLNAVYALKDLKKQVAKNRVYRRRGSSCSRRRDIEPAALRRSARPRETSETPSTVPAAQQRSDREPGFKARSSSSVGRRRPGGRAFFPNQALDSTRSTAISDELSSQQRSRRHVQSRCGAPAAKRRRPDQRIYPTPAPNRGTSRQRTLTGRVGDHRLTDPPDHNERCPFVCTPWRSSPMCGTPCAPSYLRAATILL